MRNSFPASADKRSQSVRRLTTTAMFGALSTVLMYLSISVPFMPSFIKLDLSDLPALLASFSLGPLNGVIVCLIKNLFSLLSTSTEGVGELANFLLSALFVLPAGLFYRYVGGQKGAMIGSVLGTLLMGFLSLLVNYYILYPIYTTVMPLETILGLYQAINPNIQNLWQALLCFNLPFTLIKGLLSVVLCALLYKRLSVVLKRHKLK